MQKVFFIIRKYFLTPNPDPLSSQRCDFLPFCPGTNYEMVNQTVHFDNK